MSPRKIKIMKPVFFFLLWRMLALFGNVGPYDPDPDPGREWDGLDGNRDEIKEWWHEFQRNYSHPLYAVLLAGSSDREVVQLLLNHNDELDAISGSVCGFIFFRDLRRRKNFEPYIYSEYSRRMYPLARYIGIDFSKFPCILFFEQLDSGQYIHVSLQGLSQEEIIILVRKLMSHVRQSKSSRPFDSLRRFKYSQTLVKSSKELGSNVLEIGKAAFVELIKSLATFHR